MGDAKLLEACLAFIAAHEDMQRWGDDDDAPDADGEVLSTVWYKHLELATALVPQTAAGAIAKAMVGMLALESLELTPVSREERAAMAALRDIVALRDVVAEPMPG